MKTNRITEKHINRNTTFYSSSYGNIYQFEKGKACSIAINKLGQLEDIEEELGIDLITLFSLKVGTRVYLPFGTNAEYVIESIYGIGKDMMYHICPKGEKSGFFAKLWEYGTTWALTKEELE